MMLSLAIACKSRGAPVRDCRPAPTVEKKEPMTITHGDGQERVPTTKFFLTASPNLQVFFPLLNIAIDKNWFDDGSNLQYDANELTCPLGLRLQYKTQTGLQNLNLNTRGQGAVNVIKMYVKSVFISCIRWEDSESQRV